MHHGRQGGDDPDDFGRPGDAGDDGAAGERQQLRGVLRTQVQ